MKKFLVLFCAAFLISYMFGCGKKEVAMEEVQGPLTMEVISTLPESAQAVTEVKPQTPVSVEKLEPMPPQGPYKPSAQEIQTALKNAGFYTGNIDGKAGPLTKKATEEFQKANSLEADGKVGPKTWAVLEKYLNPAATAAPAKKR